MPEVNLGKVVGPVGPQGPAGPQGPQGIQGVKGDKGDPGAGVNPNLLCNWYFVGGGSQQGGGQFPINQRGKTEYPLQLSYVHIIDRYVHVNMACTLTESGLICQTEDRIGVLAQIIERSLAKTLVGGTYTYSCLSGDNHFSTATYKINDLTIAGVQTISHQFEDGAINVMTPYFPNDSHHELLRFAVNSKQSLTLKAIKIEQGDQQTLAHQEGDKWVLNEIPDPALELARCQRYYLRLTGDGLAEPKNVILARQGAKSVEFFIPTPVPMRANPAFRIVAEVTLMEDASMNYSGSAVAGENGVYFRVNDTNGHAENYDFLYPAALQFSRDFLELDAEL